jgi:hypothetical protein
MREDTHAMSQVAIGTDSLRRGGVVDRRRLHIDNSAVEAELSPTSGRTPR